ncbi:MAG: AmmeMemoRadiSam system protein A [Bacteroidota bacterium]|nr:AmmeMemoRadiSam system protein A [Bacteroidota bacterium]
MAGRAIAEKIDPCFEPSADSAELSGRLQSRCGAFVSVYVDRELRGCIGTFSEEDPLYKNVTKMAKAAATEDSRFTSIHPDELTRAELEISILTPRQRIHDPSEIIIGVHGIYIKQGGNRGTLLPQVAVNQNWSVNEFLGNCSKYKAGIGWNGWKTAELYTYEAIVFKSDMPSY